MAKVSRRKKDEQIVGEKKILTNQELIKVETTPLEVENSKLLMAVEEQNLRNLLLEQKLLESKIEKQKQSVERAHAKYAQSKQKYESIIGGIMQNHGLSSEKFGYNSETGEIIA